ncbi:BolA family protein [Spartinivicinus poritis]|uniref:BolA/IbaG family iron-sulfur metabolism protein n=1 Tax=Spartinivicinus poritis TaxID=2994640 RepID=A0ABT5U7G5_9GAMM|nr:BolA/IbaG family iron-sulfur metabolism protein [Spartinivicinus sp. A2-2]MDE1462322.1 BolA/IbaG family iron-sulfur metabolism protein [Spartinivicinus sp. A2-2]
MSVQTEIEQKLTKALKPAYLAVTNESHMHNVPPGSESHFKVVVVSADFSGKMPVKRHQLIYCLLAEEVQHKIHALALHTYTPDEWKKQAESAPDSPNCANKR